MYNATRSGWAAAMAVALIAGLASCGGSHSKAHGSGIVVDVTMTDNTFQPSRLQVPKGETVTLRFKNAGTARHEAVLGDDAAQAEHAEEMTASTASTSSTTSTTFTDDDGHGDDGHGGDGHGTSPHADAKGITVEPGMTGEITRTFEEAGTTTIGCHEPGHWEAGMKATIRIT